MPESRSYPPPRGRGVCMIIFALADDIASLRRVLATAALPAEHVSHNDVLASDEAGGARGTMGMLGIVAEDASSDDLWMFNCASAECSSVSTNTADSAGHLPRARYQAALAEMQQWQRLLRERHVILPRRDLSSTSDRLTHNTEADHATVGEHVCKETTTTATSLHSRKPHAPMVCSTEGTECLSLFWAHAPHTTMSEEAVEFDVDGSPFPVAGGGVVIDDSLSERPLLCIDVGGIYLATSQTCSVPPGTQGVPTKRSEGVVTKTLKKQKSVPTKPNEACSLHSYPTGRRSDINAHRDHVKEMTGKSNTERPKHLCCLLQQRFASATRTCPSRTDTGTSPCPLTLEEVWVMPLLAEDNDAIRPVSVADLGLVALPCRTPTRCDQKSDDCTTAKERSVRLFRVRRHPPAHVLRVTDDDHMNSFCQPCLTHGQAVVPGSRKRLRDTATGKDNESGESQGSVPPTTRALQGGVFLRPCGGSSGVVDAVLPESRPTRLRVLKSSFLHRSLWFSAWCCASDFDVTQVFLHPHLDGNANGYFQCDTLYSILRRCVVTEEAVVHHLLEEEVNTRGTTYGSLCSADGGKAPQAFELQRSSTEALFTDSAFEDKKWEGTGVRECERVWPLEELWGLWVRLGWTPPLTWPCVRVGLHLTEGTDQGNLRRRCAWELSPRAWQDFLVRASTALDAAYIEERQLRHPQQLQKDIAAAGASSDVHAACTGHREKTARSLSVGPLRGKPSVSDDQREMLIQIQRLLEFQTALSGAAGLVTQAVSSEQMDSATTSTFVPYINPCTATRFEDFCSGSPVFSAAARDLAADIAATTVLPARHPLASPTSCVSEVASFGLTWLTGVLESPALLIPSLGVPGMANAKEGVEDLLDASHHPISRGAVSKEVDSLSSFLLGESASRLGKLLQDTSALCSPSHPPHTPPLSLPIDSEMYCEVADVAELRWSSPRVVTTAAHQKAVFSPTSPAPAPKASSRASAAESCCALACVELARLARAKTAEEVANAYHTLRRRLSNANPLSAFLFTHCVTYLQHEGVLTAPLSPSKEGVGEGTVRDSREEGEQVFSDVCAASCSGVTGLSSPLSSRSQLHESHPQVGAATPSSPVYGCCSDNKNTPPGEEGNVNTILAETVVRIVQQNKSVVRRILALIQSYSDLVIDATAGSDVGMTLASSPHRAVVAETSLLESKDAVARCVWRCLEPEKEVFCSTEKTVDDSPFCISSCARVTARRLLEEFWENVAATVRQCLGNQLGDSSPDGEDSTGDSEEEAAAPVEETAFLSESCDGAAYARAEAVEPLTSGGLHSEVAGHGGAEPETTDSSTLFSSSKPEAHTVNCLPMLPDLASSISVEHPAGLLRQAARALDGAQAMALYMQHILRCSSAAGKTQSHTCLDGCPLLRCASMEPRAETSSKADAAAPPVSSQQTNLWTHHTLFLLSYGLACPTAQSVAPSGTETVIRNVSFQESEPVRSFAEKGQLAVPPPPALAAFRALRSGKLLLDVWCGVALEVYVRRWKLAAETRCSL